MKTFLLAIYLVFALCICATAQRKGLQRAREDGQIRWE